MNQSQSQFLSTTNEPPLQDLLDDSTLQLLMKRDGVRMEDLTDLLCQVRKRMLAARWRYAA